MAAVQSNEVYPTPLAPVRLLDFGGALDKRFPFCKSCHNGQEPSLATGSILASHLTMLAPSAPTRKGAMQVKFWGDTVQIDDGARMAWMRQPRYYLSLDPYTYSVGLVASTAMSLLVQKEGKPAMQRWLQVLVAGGTRKSLALMQIAGVDMNSPQPIHDTVAYVGRLVAELERSFD